MKSRDWFTVGVRLIGVWVCIEFITDIRTLLDIRMGYFRPLQTPFETYFLIATQHLLVGAYLLFLGHHLAGLIYREQAPKDSKTSPSDSDPKVPTS